MQLEREFWPSEDFPSKYAPGRPKLEASEVPLSSLDVRFMCATARTGRGCLRYAEDLPVCKSAFNPPVLRVCDLK